MPFSEGTVVGATILGPDGNLYCSENFGTSVYVRSAATGAVVRHQANLYGGIQAISQDGTLYSCSYHTVRATDLLGNTRWEASVPTTTFLEDLVVDAAGKVYCTSEENELYAFSAAGAQLWRLQMPATGSQTLPPTIGVDGTIFVQDGGTLLAVGGLVPAPGAMGLVVVGVSALGFRGRRRA